MRSFKHECSSCEHVDVIQRDEVVTCPTCRSRPGQQCIDLNSGSQRRPIARSHPERRAIIRELDETRIATVTTLRSAG